MKPQAKFGHSQSSGFNFFLVLKKVGDNNWKPVYKSEIKPRLNEKFEWNTFNLLTTDIVTEGLHDHFKMEFF